MAQAVIWNTCFNEEVVKRTVYETSDGKMFSDEEEANRHAVALVFIAMYEYGPDENGHDIAIPDFHGHEMVEWLTQNKEVVKFLLAGI